MVMCLKWVFSDPKPVFRVNKTGILGYGTRNSQVKHYGCLTETILSPSPAGILKMSGYNVSLHDQRDALVWRTNLTNQFNINSHLVVPKLLDDGNFVLTHPMGLLWQSFDYPTDTIFPGMALNSKILSWNSSEDPSSGAYQFQITDHQGFINLSVNKGPVRVSSVENRIIPITILTTTTNNTFSTMLGLDEYGNLQLLVGRAFPVDSCDMYNQCGSNSICSYDMNQNQVCNAIQGLKPIGQERQLRCVNNTDFIKMTKMKLPELVNTFLDKRMGLEECKERCIRDCNCTAFANLDTRNGGSGCVMWSEELYDIRYYSTGGQDLYIKLSAEEDLGNNMSASTIGLITGATTLLMIFIIFLLYKTRKRIARAIENLRAQPETHEDWQSQVMDYEVISRATNFFSDSNKIGEGGYGSVYKGRLLTGLEIAVKRLISMTPNGIDNFDNEVRLIGLVQHINIIRLVGYFSNENEKLLVYEYLDNLGLDIFLFDTTRSYLLNWQKRFDIITGISRGLLYLHQDSRFKIIHLDLKPSNILLGKDMIPKISDFGMAKTLESDETEAIATNIGGTHGYMSPEYLRDKIYSDKTDIYSFGVLLLEIISGKRNYRFPVDNDGESLLSYAWKKWSQGHGLEIVHPVILNSPEFRPEQILRCIQIGLLCVQLLPQDRPTMCLVVLMLGSETFDVDVPKFPIDNNSSSSEDLYDETHTVCQMSVSAINGR